jgi:hypothetical protein
MHTAAADEETAVRLFLPDDIDADFLETSASV